MIAEDKCSECDNALLFSTEEYIPHRRILAMYNKYNYKRIENGSTKGVQMLKDVR